MSEFQSHPTLTFAGSVALIGFGRLFSDLAKSAGSVTQILPWLSAASYTVGIIAAIVTIIYTIRNKK